MKNQQTPDLDDETNSSTFGLEIKVPEPIPSTTTIEPIKPIVSIETIGSKTNHVTNLTIKPKFPLTIVPFYEKLDTTSVFRCKNWMNSLLMSTKRLYILFSKSRNQFYWDVRHKEDLRNTNLFGPFNTQEEAFDHLSKHYSWGKNVIERLE